ncbi:SusC/RagA family TonB-linked outer membrane protein [Pedobacter caeni]|uniref:TonB-linked outer membrane protein, SusC/RagA family n=1 Tax=Pedobacter caeni TaxID=288992 RepID=A0A1M5EN63_9SPHI|nr:TonB-dependent receptor [Pedobacter caeni]SHF80540.1 TonB-linked outer membrane protein, SusC/RagA family [Pedobacter caeni]
MKKILTMIGIVICLLPNIVSAQSTVVSGTVKEKGGPLPGAGITEKGVTGNGTMTDAKGSFRITLKGTSQILIIKNIGYKTQEVNVAGNPKVEVTLEEDASHLEEVVVVGYGTQKKVNLTGSVATIDSKSLENRPITNLSSALAGLAPGVFVRQSSGRPGSDGATIRIRGTGTLNSNDALVIVDGIQGTMDAVNPEDVESISVLKDAASAAIYGSLAANGVILVTTKKGSKKKTVVTYSGIFSKTNPSNMPGFVTDYVRHMNLVNEGYRNLGNSGGYNQSTIDAWTSANQNPSGVNALGVPNSIAFPNTDWADVIFENKVLQNHNVTLNGGAENISFLLSAGYLGNPGTMANTEVNRYQFRANVEAKVAKFLTVGTQTFASMRTKGMGNTDNAFNFLRQTTPGVYPYLDGKYGFPSAKEESSTSNNILSYLNSTGGSDRESRFNTTLYATLDIIKGLKLETKFNYQTRFFEGNAHSIPLERWDFATNELRSPATAPAQLSTSYGFDKNYTLTVDNVLRYSTVINDDHDFGALVGYNQNYYNYYDLSASKLGLISPDITTIGSGTTMSNMGGKEYDRAMRSWFGRVNYAYKQRYLLEAVLRYDGASKFAKENRYGVFPSFSAGWRISEESFMKNISEKVQNLKLRASWGKVGNNKMHEDDDKGNYDYMSNYSKVNSSFNGTPASGLWRSKLPNADLQWESTTIANLGLDGSLFKGAVNFEFDWYQKKTVDILYAPEIPLVVGQATPPTRNIAAMLNRGIELTLGYRGASGDFRYSASANFSYNYNRVSKYRGTLNEGYGTDAQGNRVFSSNIGQVASGDREMILEGHSIREYYLYNVYKGTGSYTNSDGSVNINGGPKDGMIRTPGDLDWVKSMLAAGYKFLPGNAVDPAKINYGDLIYADNNGDGSYGNSFDRQFTGATATPKYNFGLQASASWKGIDMFMLWSGSAGMKYYWNAIGYNSSIVSLGNAVSTLIADDHYYFNPANPSDPANNINGKYPRLKNSADVQNSVASDFYLYNASYVKLKTFQLGYTFAEKLTKKVAISKARIYVSGENLFTITSYPGLDPEIGTGITYPTMRQYSLGLNLTF